MIPNPITPAYAESFPYLGHGIHREVYAPPRTGDTGGVVYKVEQSPVSYYGRPDGTNDNLREWRFWHNNADRPNLRKWLARPLYISPDYRVLVMERADQSLHPGTYKDPAVETLRSSIQQQGIDPNCADIHEGNVLPKADAPNGHGIIVVDYGFWEDAA